MRRTFNLLFLLLWSSLGPAQVDTSFWFAPPEFSSGSGEDPIRIFASSYEDSASVTVEQPANGSFTPVQFDIPPHSTDSVDLSSDLTELETKPSDSVRNTGLWIHSDRPISVSYELLADSSSATFSLKGRNAIGDEFYTPFQNEWGNGSENPTPYSSFDIVATRDSTTLLISPREDVVGHNSGSSYQVDLDRGETYSAEDVASDSVPSIAGSIVSSDSVFAVSIKEDHLEKDSCSDPIGDQIVPVDRLGTEYVVHRTGADDEKAFILTTQNGTTIEVNDGSGVNSVWLNGRETHTVPIDSPLTRIEADKPIYVMHVGGNGCQQDAAVIPPVRCAGRNEMAFHRRNGDTLGLVLTVRSGAEGEFELDGDPSLVSASDFDPVPGSGGSRMGATVRFTKSELGIGHHRIRNDTDIFRMDVFHGDPEEGFHYEQGSPFDAPTIVEAGPDDTLCANRTLQLNGSIRGGPQDGIWTTDGSGTFSDKNDLNATYELSLSDKVDGKLEFVLTSLGPCKSRSDTMQVKITPAPAVEAGPDRTICANGDGADLKGSVDQGATTGEWSSAGSGSFSPNDTTLDASYLPSDADTSSGSVKLTLTSTKNGDCLAESDSMQVTITPAPKVEASPDTTLCSNIPSVKLDGEVSGGSSQGSWSSSGSGAFNPGPNNLDPDYFPSNSDTAKDSLILSLRSTKNGDCKAVSDSLRMSFKPAPKVDAGPDDVVCENQVRAAFDGEVSGGSKSGVWSGGNGKFIPGDTALKGEYIPDSNEIANGEVTLTLTSTKNGDCHAEEDSMRVVIRDAPEASFSVGSECAEDDVFFTNRSKTSGAGALTDFSWSFGDGDSSSLQSPTHSYASGGQYETRLIVTASNGCKDTGRGKVEVHPLPTASFDYTGVCLSNGIRVRYSDRSSGNGDPLKSWSWSLGDGTNAIIRNPSHVYPNTTDREVALEVSTDEGCTDRTKDSVILQDPPKAGFGIEAEDRKLGSVIRLRDSSERTVTWEWSFGDGSIPSNDPNPEHLYSEAGRYRIVQIVRNEIGCPDTAMRTIRIQDELAEIPNAISPNGDGKNDSWNLRSLEIYSDATVRIRDRWGKEVFSSQGYAEEWDGTMNGEPLPEGTYYYVIELPDREDLRGPILLMR